MIYSGTFKTYNNEDTYGVQIGNVGYPYAIQDPQDQGFYSSGMRLVFGTEPVTITADRQDLLKRIIISQCTINLVGNENMTEEFFSDCNRNIPVTITKLPNGPNGTSVVAFYGYVDPLQFEQGWALNWEDITITATDPLGALEDLLIDQVEGIAANSIITPLEILQAICTKIGIDPNNIDHTAVNAKVWSSFQNTKINMVQFFGDDQDDRQSLYDVLEQVLKYFNMYAAMKGSNLLLCSTINQTLTNVSVTNLKDKVKDSSTSISVDDAYSRVTLTCEIEPIKDLLSFSDKDALHSKYKSMEKYMTELVCPGEGHTAHNAFTSLVMTGACDYENSYTVDHFCYILENEMFDFGDNGYTKQDFWTDDTIINDNINQIRALYWLASDKFRAAFIGFGKGDKVTNGVTDNAPIATMPLDNWLVISTLGNSDNSDLSGTINSLTSKLRPLKDNPICTYKGLNAAILSPSSSEVTNYIIISGSILLNPNQPQTGYGWSSETSKLYNTYESLRNYGWGLSSVYFENTVPNPDNGDGAYYTQRWDYVPSDFGLSSPYINHGIFGYLDNSKNQQWKYDYSKIDGNLQARDTISKIPIIACELKVGDKYCVERLDLGPTGVGKYEWLTEANCPTDDNGDKLKYFTIGIDPKIGDNILGQTHKIQNNISYKQGINASGTGIPITQDDALSGTLSFKILGPYNSVWDDNTKKTHHKWLFWKCTHENTYTRSILNNIQSIMIKDLKFDVKSDNGGRSEYTTADNDLVYYSNINPTFIEKLEDDISIVTGRKDIQSLGIKYEVSNSYVVNVNRQYDDPENPQGYTLFQGWWDGEKWIKPEECLVDYLYKEYDHPAVKMDINLSTDLISSSSMGNQISQDMLCTCYEGIYPAKGSTPVPCTIMSYTTNLKSRSSEMTIRETVHKGFNEQIPNN